MPTPVTRYSRVAQGLHWIIAALVVTQFALAYAANGQPLGIERLVLKGKRKKREREKKKEKKGKNKEK